MSLINKYGDGFGVHAEKTRGNEMYKERESGENYRQPFPFPTKLLVLGSIN